MTQAPALPFVHDATLDREQLLVVVADIEAGTELLSVNVKHGREAHSDEQPVQLKAAVAQLLDGAAVGLQIRYRYEGREYWDTLLRAPGGFRIVRIDHSAALAGA